MIKEDLNHWQNLSPPLSPNPYEVELYRHHVKGCGPVCLLGMTKELQHICDYMIDIHPTKQTKPVIKKDWNLIDSYSEAIIGDGILNLEGIDLAKKLLKNCEKLVCRVFLKKFSWMKYAKHFPNKFPGSSLIIPTQEDVCIVVWEN